MRNAIIRVNPTPAAPRAAYVASIARDGGFAITYDKAKARRFLPTTAQSYADALPRGLTRETFTVCQVAA